MTKREAEFVWEKVMMGQNAQAIAIQFPRGQWRVDVTDERGSVSLTTVAGAQTWLAERSRR